MYNTYLMWAKEHHVINMHCSVWRSLTCGPDVPFVTPPPSHTPTVCWFLESEISSDSLLVCIVWWKNTYFLSLLFCICFLLLLLLYFVKNIIICIAIFDILCFCNCCYSCCCYCCCFSHICTLKFHYIWHIFNLATPIGHVLRAATGAGTGSLEFAKPLVEHVYTTHTHQQTNTHTYKCDLIACS